MPKFTVAGKPLQFRQDVPITPPWSTIPHSDIGIATHRNQLKPMQQLPIVTLKMCPRNPRKILTMVTLTKPLTQNLTLTWILTQTQTQSPNLTTNPNIMKRQHTEEAATKIKKEHEECREHEKCDMECKHEEAAKEKQELKVTKARVAKYEAEAKVKVEVGELIGGSDASSDTKIVITGMDVKVSDGCIVTK